LSKIEGEALSQLADPQRLELYKQYGQLAAQIHQIKIEGFGYINNDNGHFRG
jgi:hypothetical protein